MSWWGVSAKTLLSRANRIRFRYYANELFRAWRNGEISKKKYLKHLKKLQKRHR